MIRQIILSGPFLAKEDRGQVLAELAERKQKRLIEKADTFAGVTVDYPVLYRKFIRCLGEISTCCNVDDEAGAIKNLADVSNYVDMIFYLIRTQASQYSICPKEGVQP